jgi:hypothetical protein
MPFTSTQPRDSVKRRIVWLGLFVISVAGLVIMTVSGIRQRNYVNCNAEQVAILIRYQREASIAAREEREAHDAVRVAQRNQDKAAELKAIDQYFEIRKKADERRANNPLPDLPQNVCGRDPSVKIK